MKKYNKILVVRLSSIGDVLLTTPVLEILDRFYPEADISYLVESKSVGIIENNDYIENTIIFDKDQLKEIYQKEGLISAVKSIWQFIKGIKARNFDLVLDLHSVFRSTIFSFFASSRESIGYNKQLSSLLYTKKVNPQEDIHVVDEYLKLLKPLGINVKQVNHEIKFSIATSEQDMKYVEGLLEKYNLKNKKLFIINPSTSIPEKNWNEKSFTRVGDWINSKTEAKIILIGSKEDYEKAERIKKNIDNAALNLAGQTNLKELTVLISKAEMLLTGDTAALHIGMTVGTPLVSLFGPTSPKRYGPYKGDNIVIESMEDDIDKIPVCDVIRGIKKILNEQN